MIEQKVIIQLVDEDSNEFGTLTVSSLDYNGNHNSNLDISHSISLNNGQFQIFFFNHYRNLDFRG